MDYLHHEFDTGAGDLIEVTLDHPANVYLLDETNYARYRNKQPFQYSAGGYAESSPVRWHPPHAGRWHVVIDLGGGPGRVRASARLVPEGSLVFDGR